MLLVCSSTCISVWQDVKHFHEYSPPKKEVADLTVFAYDHALGNTERGGNFCSDSQTNLEYFFSGGRNVADFTIACDVLSRI